MNRESIKLGDATYYIRVMPPFQATHVLGELLQKFGPAMSLLMDADGRLFTGPAVSATVQKLCLSLSGAEMERLGRMLLDPECISVQIEGEPAVKLDANAQIRHLRGAHDLIRLCAEVVVVNYRPFWQEGGFIGWVLSLLPQRPPENSALN